jgi:hypothetical protein
MKKMLLSFLLSLAASYHLSAKIYGVVHASPVGECTLFSVKFFEDNNNDDPTDDRELGVFHVLKCPKNYQGEGSEPSQLQDKTHVIEWMTEGEVFGYLTRTYPPNKDDQELSIEELSKMIIEWEKKQEEMDKRKKNKDKD